MIQFIRNRSKGLMWCLVIVVVVSFSFWGVNSFHDASFEPTASVGRIDGKNISMARYEKALREVHFSTTLGSGSLLPQTDEFKEFLRMQAWNRLVMLHEAERKGFNVTDEEVIEYIKKHPLFIPSEKGSYDPARYQLFVERTLPAFGMNEEQFHEFMRHECIMAKVVEQINADVQVTNDEDEKKAHLMFDKVKMASVAFDYSQFEAGLTIPEDAIQSAYQKNIARFSSPQKNQVKYVHFSLPPDQAALPDKERGEALRKMGEDAVTFTVDLLGEEGKQAPSFEEVAAKHKLAVQQTDFFSQDQPPKDFKDMPFVVAAAFRLTSVQPDSDVILGKESFFVLHLLNTLHPVPQPLEKVRPVLVTELTKEKAIDSAFSAALQVREKIAEKIKSGTSFEQAAKDEKLKAVFYAPFIPMEKIGKSQDKKDLPACVIRWSHQLENGETSQPDTFDGGAMVVCAVSREKQQITKEQMESVKERLLEQKRQTRFRQWMSAAMQRKETEFKLAK